MDFKKYKDKLIFLPLGGTKEIGLNLNLYHFDGKWLIIDLGIGFAGNIPGVEIMVPDPKFIEKIKKDVLAIIITHAHEDHLGAVQYLWEEIEAPVYTSKFTGRFLEEKLKEYNLDKKVPIHLKKEREKFSIGKFDLEFFEINHSVPEMNAVIIEAGGKRVFHTGDWKFDDNPVLGKPDDYKELAKIGKSGVTAMISDSTNVFSNGHSGSEGDLQKSLIALVKEQKNLVIISSFASNVSRFVSIYEAAKQSGRKLVLCGRALMRVSMIAFEMGYLENDDVIIEREEIKQYPRNKILVFATGSQGEDRAALKRIARNDYPFIKLRSEDTVILSSKMIPGNELKIGEILNLFARKNIRVITEKEHFTHVSGHPYKDEIIKMYNLIKPEIAIPVHGEEMHIHRHAELAKEIGIKKSVICSNGDCVIIDEKNPETIGQVHNGYLAVDGTSLIPLQSPILKARQKMSYNGIVVAMIKLQKKGKIESVKVIAPGLLDANNDQEVLDYFAERIENDFEGELKSSNGLDISKFHKKISNKLRKVIYESLGKEPYIEVNFL